MKSINTHSHRMLFPVAICVLAIVAIFAASTIYADGTTSNAQPKYVIVLIGDGMAMPQRMATEYALSALDGNSPPKPGSTYLNMNRLPVQSPTTTYSANSFITDSAAAGTALATGVKTDNGKIGVDPAGKKYTTLGEAAKSAGMRVGVVSSVSIDHATPASYFAHEKSRSSYGDISKTLPLSQFDFFGGGGLKGSPLGENGQLQLPEASTVHVARTLEQIRAVKAIPEGKTLYAISPVLYKDAAMPDAIDRVEDIPTLADYTREAIRLLEGDGGFFLMIEGGKIDWTCHANDSAAMVAEVLEFDAAVKVALDFLHAHPDETLVIVTGDHETGGLTLGRKETAYKLRPEILLKQKTGIGTFDTWCNENPDAKSDDALAAAVEFFGLDGLSKGDQERLRTVWRLQRENRIAGDRPNLRTIAKEAGASYPSSVTPFTTECQRVRDRMVGVAWASGTHTALPVITSAKGIGADRFVGLLDNTDIAHRLAEIIGLQLANPTGPNTQ